MSSTSAETTARPALRRDGDHKLLLGVCAGLARILDTEPWVVRAAAIVIGIFTGPLAIVAYVTAAAIVPRDDGRMLLNGDPPDKRENVLGWIGVVVACSMLLAAAPHFDVFWVDDGMRVPVVIVAVILGVIVLARGNKDRTLENRVSAATATPTAPAPAPAPAAEPVVEDTPDPDPDVVEGDAVTTETRLPATLPATRVVPTRRPDSDPAHPGGPGGPEDPTEVRPPDEPERPREPRGRSLFFPVAGTLIAAAGLIVVLATLGAFDVDARAAAVMLGVGAVLAGLSAAFAAGRRGTGAVLALGILLAFAASGVAVADDQLDDGVGQRVVRPASAADLKPEYRLGVGQIDLDLRDTRLPVGTPTTVTARLGVGEILLHVAPDVRVETIGDDGATGELAPQVTRKGVTAPVVRLDADTDIGAVRVER